MAIKLFDRIATLVKADAHGLVESLEERSLLLKQYEREAESSSIRSAPASRRCARRRSACARLWRGERRRPARSTRT